MTTEEIRRQRIIANAEMERLKHQQSIGLTSTQKVLDHSVVVQQFKKPIAVTPVVNNEDKIRTNFAQKIDEETDLTLAEIRAELHAIDAAKNKLINQLAAAPITSNQKELVAQIKALRADWVNKSDEVYYYLNHGERYQPVASVSENATDLMQSLLNTLPKDKFILNKRLMNRRSDLSKYKARLKEAKTEVKKAHQQKNIAQAELEINAIEQLMSSI